MSRWKKVTFDRWNPKREHSWPYRVFRQYDDELMRLIISHESVQGYTYAHLKNDGATWESLAKDFGLRKDDRVQTIKQWSENYKTFGTWFRLSLLMSLNSYFETYIAAIIKECIESDPGLLFGLSHEIDGMSVLKGHKTINRDEISEKIKQCTKGTWSSRIGNMTNLFGNLPQFSGHVISRLESLRIIRNKVGHAFGRDIVNAQKYLEVSKLNMQNISVASFNKYHTLIFHLVQELDSYLVQNHIGNFEPLYHYHHLCTEFKDLDKGEKMLRLKASLYKDKKSVYSKDFCRGIVKYYDEL